MLVGEQDVAIMAKDEIGDSRDHALAVGTGDEKYGGGVHRLQVSSVYPCVLCGSSLKSLTTEDTGVHRGIHNPGAISSKLAQFRARHSPRSRPLIPFRDACRCRTDTSCRSV